MCVPHILNLCMFSIFVFRLPEMEKLSYVNMWDTHIVQPTLHMQEDL
jgi:hypothetical protein